MTQHPEVSLIVVNRDGQQHLERLMPSLEALEFPRDRLETIVVDNGSSDGSVKWLARHYPRIRTLSHDKNTFCAANNFGIRHAQGKFIGLLNNDCRVDPHWLARLIRVLRRHRRIGAVGSKVLFEDGTIDSAGLQELPNFYWGDRGFYEPDQGQYDRVERRKALSAVAMLIRRECFEEVGPFDEDFEFYYEDVDWCLRCQERRWEVRYIPESVVWHRLHGTSTFESAKRYAERNRLLLVAKHAPRELPAVLETATYFIEQESLDPLCEVTELVCQKLVEVHGREVAAPVMVAIVQRLSRIIQGHTTAGVTALQRELGRVRDALDAKTIDCEEITVLKRGMDQSIQLLAGEVDHRQAMVDQLHVELAQHETDTAPEKSLQEELSRLTEAYKALQEDSAALQKAREHVQLSYRGSQQSLKLLRDDQMKLEEHHRSLLATKTKLEGAEVELRSELAGVRSALHTLEQEHGSLLQNFHDLEENCETLRMHNRGIREDQVGLQSSHRSLQEVHESLTKAHGEAQDKVARLQQQHTALEAEHASLQEANDRIQEAYQEAVGALERMKADQQELEVVHRDLLQVRATLEESYESLERAHGVLLEGQAARSQEHETLVRRYADLETERIEYERALTTLEQEHDKLQQRHTDVQRERDEARQMHGMLQRDHAALQEARLTLQGQHRDTAQALERLRDQQQQIQQTSEAIQREHVILREAHERLQVDHRDLTAEHGRVFHDRTVLQEQVQRIMRTPWYRLGAFAARCVRWVRGGWRDRRTAAREAGWRTWRQRLAGIARRIVQSRPAQRSEERLTRAAGTWIAVWYRTLRTWQEQGREPMQIARILKYGSWSVFMAGGWLAAETLTANPAAAFACVVAGVLGTFCIRLFANVGQLVFEQRQESQRMLANVERSLYQQSALTREIRDMVKEGQREARTKERVAV